MSRASSPRYPSLRGQVAFVTGGATGLGAEFVDAARRPGRARRASSTSTGRRGPRARARPSPSAGTPSPLYQHCDVRDIPALQAAIAETAERLGPVTVLVNNAANDRAPPVEDAGGRGVGRPASHVNVRHHFFATQAVAPMMREAGGGSVINLGSISAHIDLLDLPVYITAKAASKGSRARWRASSARTTSASTASSPGWIMTQRQLDTLGHAGGRRLDRRATSA